VAHRDNREVGPIWRCGKHGASGGNQIAAGAGPRVVNTPITRHWSIQPFDAQEVANLTPALRHCVRRHRPQTQGHITIGWAPEKNGRSLTEVQWPVMRPHFSEQGRLKSASSAACFSRRNLNAFAQSDAQGADLVPIGFALRLPLQLAKDGDRVHGQRCARARLEPGRTASLRLGT
jgi:hypothetical protein